MAREFSAEKQAMYVIHVVAGSSTVDPNIHTVRAGTEVVWELNAGTGRVLFASQDIVTFAKDTATPGSPARATARERGTHHHTISVWIDRQVTQAVRAVLIVE